MAQLNNSTLKKMKAQTYYTGGRKLSKRTAREKMENWNGQAKKSTRIGQG